MRLVQKSTSPLAVSVDSAKEFLRVLDTDEEIIIESLIKATQNFAQNYTNTQITRTSFELYTDALYDGFKMVKNPIASIESISYMDENGVYQPFTDFYTFCKNGMTLLHVENMPTTKIHEEAIKIVFNAGYLEVPSDLQQWIKVKLATLYEFRENFVLGVSVSEIPHSFVDCMLDAYKIKEF